MNQSNQQVNEPLLSTTAPLKNVALCTVALAQAMERPQHLPGLVAFYGPSGWGKTVSATYANNKFRAYYVSVKESWTRQALLKAILKEMGIQPERTNYEMVDQVSEQLALSGKPLIIDEFDNVVNRNMVELIRDIYEGSNAAILMIGEEYLEKNLRKWERFHNRVLDWVPAQPTDMDDVRHLARLYCKGVTITDDLLAHLVRINKGITRRICVNLERFRRTAISEGLETMDLATWGDREIFTGEAPKRRNR